MQSEQVAPQGVGNTNWQWPSSTLKTLVDGDTGDFMLTRDIGFHGTVTFRQRLRLNRIDAPKSTEEVGKISRLGLWRLLSDGNGYSNTFYIETIKPYKYGDEWMAEITLNDGTNISDEMVRLGLAVYWNGKGPRPAGEGPHGRQ